MSEADAKVNATDDTELINKVISEIDEVIRGKVENNATTLELIFKMKEAGRQEKEARIQNHILLEERVRKKYEMFRDIIREENTLINARLGTHRGVTGFLWGTITLGIGSLDSNKEKSLILLSFFLVVAFMGIFVTVETKNQVNNAYEAIDDTNKEWKEVLRQYEGNIELRWPKLMGKEPPPTLKPKPWNLYAIFFIFGWIIILVVSLIVVFCVSLDKISFGSILDVDANVDATLRQSGNN